MNRMRATRSCFSTWIFVLLMVVGSSLGLAENAIHSITFDPPTPAALALNQRVQFSFSYTVEGTGLVLIRARPMTAGAASPNTAVELSTDQVSGSGSFTVTAGAVTVDQVRFQMLDIGGDLLHETLVDVRYTFGDVPTPDPDDPSPGEEEFLVEVLWASWESDIAADPIFATMQILAGSPTGQPGDVFDLSWLTWDQPLPDQAQGNRFRIWVGETEFWGTTLDAVLRYELLETDVYDPTAPVPCPPGALARHVEDVETGGGTFAVEACVVREDGHDLYRYTIRNVELGRDIGEGNLCHFHVPNLHGLTTLDQWAPEGWLLNEWWEEWSWTASPSYALVPGEFATVGFTVPAPTVPVLQETLMVGCLALLIHPPDESSFFPRIPFETLGPAHDPLSPSGLVVDDVGACWFEHGGNTFVEAWAQVRNEGTEPLGNVVVRFEAGETVELLPLGDLEPGVQGFAQTEVRATLPTTVSVTAYPEEDPVLNGEEGVTRRAVDVEEGETSRCP